MRLKNTVRSCTALCAVSVAAVAFGAALSGCSGGSGTKESPYAETTRAATRLYGDPVPLATGTIRSYVTLDASGQPAEFGVIASKGAMGELPPVLVFPFTSPIDVPLPANVPSGLPFRSITFFYTAGHEPGAYEAPHYHVSFAFLTNAQRSLITGNDDPSLFNAPVPAKYIPATFVNFSDYGPFEVPTVGNVYYDPSVPEFQNPPQPFTHEFDIAFFGGFQSADTVTSNRAVLVDSSGALTGASTGLLPLRLPQAYQESGYYPTTYGINYDAATQSYLFTLGGLTYRNAG